MCKSSDVFSLAVLIDRGLDLCTKGGIVLGFLGEWLFDVLPLLLSRFPLYSVLRVYTLSSVLESYGHAPLAQLVEHLTLNQGVPGSSP